VLQTNCFLILIAKCNISVNTGDITTYNVYLNKLGDAQVHLTTTLVARFVKNTD